MEIANAVKQSGNDSMEVFKRRTTEHQGVYLERNFASAVPAQCTRGIFHKFVPSMCYLCVPIPAVSGASRHRGEVSVRL